MRNGKQELTELIKEAINIGITEEQIISTIRKGK